jgi:signal transduction histidine kinase
LAPLLQLPDLQRNRSSGAPGGNYCLVILDDRGKPVALSLPGYRGDWKHPFVATEIGEGLPHWEAALYLLDTQQIRKSASTLQLTLGSIVFALIGSILLGGWLMATDVRHQMRLAQQKTDFVSNVSHELKTPLTSIRMFADMLADGRVNDPGRRTQYLRIIAAESSRLTRLINNVLDFARLERGEASRELRECDLVEIAKEVIDTCRPHLEEANVALSLEIGTASLLLVADRDALAQIILNLISNAEKYGGGDIVVRLRREEGFQSGSGYVDVLDRGRGIPTKQLGKVFEPFQRLEDSLSSGVSGSGLGLTLARRMAQAHGGNVTYSPREGGGSCFTLRLPLQPSIETQ